MKLFVKLMLAALVVGFLLPFTLLKDDEGKTLMSFSDFSLSDFKMPDFKMPDMLASDKLLRTNGGGSRKDVFYRWNDAKGNVHFTTEPPPGGIKYTVKGYNPDTNLIQAVEIPVEEPVVAPPPPGSEPASGNKSSAQDLDSPYSKDNIQKLFDDTGNLEQMFNQRYNNQNSAANQ
jgi:hypothetical protein